MGRAVSVIGAAWVVTGFSCSLCGSTNVHRICSYISACRPQQKWLQVNILTVITFPSDFPTSQKTFPSVYYTYCLLTLSPTGKITAPHAWCILTSLIEIEVWVFWLLLPAIPLSLPLGNYPVTLCCQTRVDCWPHLILTVCTSRLRFQVLWLHLTTMQTSLSLSFVHSFIGDSGGIPVREWVHCSLQLWSEPNGL